jgi:hypothetical protein
VDHAAEVNGSGIGRETIGSSSPTPGARFSAIAGFVGAFIVLIVIAAICGPIRMPVLIMCLAGSISFGALLRVIALKDSNPVQFTSYIYLVFFFQLPGVIHLGTQLYPWYGVNYPEWAELRAATVVLIFTVALVAGSLLGTLRPNTRPAREPRPNSHISPRAIYGAIIGLSLLSVGAGLSVGYSVLRANRGEASALFDPPTPITLILSTLATNGAFIALAVSILNFKRSNISKPTAAICFVLALVVFLMANNILSLPRYAIGAYAITLFFSWSSRGPRLKLLLLLALVFSQFTIFPILSDVARGGGLSSFRFDPIEYISNHGDFDGFQSTINVVIYVIGGGLLMGKQLLSAALFFIPRYLFPTKSIGLGGDSASFVGYRFINISSPLPSELYADFGLIGLTILAALTGFAIGKIDYSYARASLRFDPFGLLVPSVIAGYSFIIMRGSLVGVLGPVLVTVMLSSLVRSLIGRPNSVTAPDSSLAAG